MLVPEYLSPVSRRKSEPKQPQKMTGTAGAWIANEVGKEKFTILTAIVAELSASMTTATHTFCTARIIILPFRSYLTVISQTSSYL